jgi:hypothetical protein
MLGIAPMILRRLKVSSDSTIGTSLSLISESSRLCLSNDLFGSSFFGESYIKPIRRLICEGWSRHLLIPFFQKVATILMHEHLWN